MNITLSFTINNLPPQICVKFVINSDVPLDILKYEIGESRSKMKRKETFTVP